jgi:vesicle transport protein SEC22
MGIENIYIARVTDGLVLVASMEHSSGGERMELFKNQAKQLLKKLNPRSVAKMSIESSPFIFHYVIEDGVCYLTLTDRSYPKRLSFLFLEDISREFVASLKNDFGDDWQHELVRACDSISPNSFFLIFFIVHYSIRKQLGGHMPSLNLTK